MITGSAGFLASHITDRFLADGHQVMGVDNLVTGSHRNLQHLHERDDFRLVEHDISEPFFLDEILEWEPKTSLRQGLRKTIPYFRKLVEEEDAEARVL